MSPLAPAGAALILMAALWIEKAQAWMLQAGMAAAYSNLDDADAIAEPWERRAARRCLQSWIIAYAAVIAAFLAGFSWGRL